MKKKRIRKVLFDFDGTLRDSIPGYLEALNLTLKHFRIDRQLTLLEYYELPLPWNEHYPRLTPHVEAREFLETYAHHSKSRLPRARLMPNAFRVIQALAERRLVLGIVSGAHRDEMERALTRFGLAGMFRVLIHAPGGVKHQVLKDFCRNEDLDPTTIAYLGDSPTDIEAAREAGMVALAIAAHEDHAKLLAKQRPHYPPFFSLMALLPILERHYP